jgi:two-component system sensor kinase FixL
MNLIEPISAGKRLLVFAVTALSVLSLTFIERVLGVDVPIVPLFFLPLFAIAAVVPRWAAFFIAIMVALEREIFGPFNWGEGTQARLSVSIIAFAGGALLACELIRNRRISAELSRMKERDSLARADSEREFRAFVENIPSAVLVVNSDGKIELANAGARRLLGFNKSSPEGEPVESYVPQLAKLLKSDLTSPIVRTRLETTGSRSGGETFSSHVWVSVYESFLGPRLCALLSDVTEASAEQEEIGLRQLLTNTGMSAAPVSDGLRHLTSAASILYRNLKDCAGVRDNLYYDALGRVLECVEKLSTKTLPQADSALEDIDVTKQLEDLRAIVATSSTEDGTAVEWEIAKTLPLVHANGPGLLQVFINLAQSRCAALKGKPQARLRVTAYSLSGAVLIRFVDNAPRPTALQTPGDPADSRASSTGLGLLVSRAIVGTFGGKVHHTEPPGESCFIIELPAAKLQGMSHSA